MGCILNSTSVFASREGTGKKVNGGGGGGGGERMLWARNFFLQYASPFISYLLTSTNGGKRSPKYKS